MVVSLEDFFCVHGIVLCDPECISRRWGIYTFSHASNLLVWSRAASCYTADTGEHLPGLGSCIIGAKRGSRFDPMLDLCGGDSTILSYTEKKIENIAAAALCRIYNEAGLEASSSEG